MEVENRGHATCLGDEEAFNQPPITGLDEFSHCFPHSLVPHRPLCYSSTFSFIHSDLPMDPPPPMDGHVVVTLYLGRGHIKPLMHLCNILLSRNSNILFTFVITKEWHRFIGFDSKPHNVHLQTTPNVIPSKCNRENDMVTFLDAAMSKMEAPFEHLLDLLD